MEGGIQGEIEKLRWRERNGDTDLEKRRVAAKEMKETEIQGSGRGPDSKGKREGEPERQIL